MRILFLPLLFVAWTGQTQSILGKWKTIDDHTKEERSVVEIFERSGKVYGRITRLFTKAGEDPDPVCDKCPEDDSRFRKKIIGMEIIREMKKDNGEYVDGDILDPEEGKIYRCKLWLDGNELKVRGYWGPFYRTQTWMRAD
jgi:uncharacterized protein (DUF2147 family)